MQLPHIVKEVDSREVLYCATLENGVTINVYDGYALGSDGKTYHFVGREILGQVEHLGWSSEIDSTLIYEEELHIV